MVEHNPSGPKENSFGLVLKDERIGLFKSFDVALAVARLSGLGGTEDVVMRTEAVVAREGEWLRINWLVYRRGDIDPDTSLPTGEPFIHVAETEPGVYAITTTIGIVPTVDAQALVAEVAKLGNDYALLRAVGL